MALAWAVPGFQGRLARERASQAWEVRRGDLLEDQAEDLRDRGDSGADLSRARALYLEGRLLDCLASLSGRDRELTDPERELRREAERALAVEVPWPATVPRHVFRASGPRDLGRVVDDGPGEDLYLEAFGTRHGRYGRLELELRGPSGEALRQGREPRLPLGLVTRLDAPKLGEEPVLRVEHERDGQKRLDLAVATEWGLAVYRFQGPRSPTLEGRTVRVPRKGGGTEGWRWEEGKFRRLD